MAPLPKSSLIFKKISFGPPEFSHISNPYWYPLCTISKISTPIFSVGDEAIIFVDQLDFSARPAPIARLNSCLNSVHSFCILNF